MGGLEEGSEQEAGATFLAVSSHRCHGRKAFIHPEGRMGNAWDGRLLCWTLFLCVFFSLEIKRLQDWSRAKLDPCIFLETFGRKYFLFFVNCLNVFSFSYIFCAISAFLALQTSGKLPTCLRPLFRERGNLFEIVCRSWLFIEFGWLFVTVVFSEHGKQMAERIGKERGCIRHVCPLQAWLKGLQISFFFGG